MFESNPSKLLIKESFIDFKGQAIFKQMSKITFRPITLTSLYYNLLLLR